MDDAIRLAVLISGNGTTLQNLLDRIAAGRLRARVVLVVSNKAEVFGLVRASQAGVPTAVVERKHFLSREEFSAAIFDRCRQARANLVCLGGFLQLLFIPEDFLGRVLNIHPALIPAFCGQGLYGHRVHEAVLAYGAKVSGCTVHYADNQYDHGPIIHDHRHGRTFGELLEIAVDQHRPIGGSCFESDDQLLSDVVVT
jgi:phosphoribosylglycinamide formyltransferase 1